MENTNQSPLPAKRSKQEIRSFTELWKESGKNKTQFCLENNLNYQTFIGWTNPKKKKSPVEKKSKHPESPGFASLKIKNPESVTFAEVHLADGAKIYLHQTVPVNYLKELIR